MGLYARYILPRLVHITCATPPLMRQREKIVPLARGEVLEIGAGSGLNLRFYDPQGVAKLLALEPSAEMRVFLEKEAAEAPCPVELVDAPGESIPLESGSVDSVVVTYSLCSVSDLVGTLAECRRVLRSGGSLLFCEHGRSPDDSVYAWQRRLEPIWKRIAGGCHLARDIPGSITEAGFRLDRLETMYLPGPRFVAYNFWGTATKG